MSNKNLTEQNAQRTSFDTLELAGYELPEEELRFVAGGHFKTKKTSPDGTTSECTCDTENMSKRVSISPS